jgi:hypothetical protein
MKFSRFFLLIFGLIFCSAQHQLNAMDTSDMDSPDMSDRISEATDETPFKDTREANPWEGEDENAGARRENFRPPTENRDARAFQEYEDRTAEVRIANPEPAASELRTNSDIRTVAADAPITPQVATKKAPEEKPAHADDAARPSLVKDEAKPAIQTTSSGPDRLADSAIKEPQSKIARPVETDSRDSIARTRTTTEPLRKEDVTIASKRLAEQAQMPEVTRVPATTKKSAKARDTWKRTSNKVIAEPDKEALDSEPKEGTRKVRREEAVALDDAKIQAIVKAEIARQSRAKAFEEESSKKAPAQTRTTKETRKPDTTEKDRLAGQAHIDDARITTERAAREKEAALEARRKETLARGDTKTSTATKDEPSRSKPTFTDTSKSALTPAPTPTDTAKAAATGKDRLAGQARVDDTRIAPERATREKKAASEARRKETLAQGETKIPAPTKAAQEGPSRSKPIVTDLTKGAPTPTPTPIEAAKAAAEKERLAAQARARITAERLAKAKEAAARSARARELAKKTAQAKARDVSTAAKRTANTGKAAANKTRH